jgi:hypothetical protein
MNNKEILKMVDSSIKRFNEIVDQYFSDNDKQAVKKLMNTFGERFFTAPASSNIKYHCCFPGGLVVHSINVFNNLKLFNENLLNNKYPMETISKIGLLHDLYKAGDYNSPYYLEIDDNWQIKRGQLYKVNDDIIQIDHETRTLMTMLRFGFTLDDEETQAILYHDGQYLEKNKEVRQKETWLTLITHWADMAAVMQEKEYIKYLL